MEVDNDNSLLECDTENVVENLNILENKKDDTTVPEVGMTFNDQTKMLDFYKRYAFAVGFPVRKMNSKKGGRWSYETCDFTCSRKGRRSYATSGSLKPQATSQTDCKARISASLDTLGIWRINKVYIDHNYKTSPSKSRLYRCNRNLSASVKRKLVVNDVAGIPLHKSYNSAVVEAGGYKNTTFVENDCRNYVEQGATTTSKGKRPRARQSTTEEGSKDVQSSQLSQRSLPTPLQNFVRLVLTNDQGVIMPHLYPHLPSQQDWAYDSR